MENRLRFGASMDTEQLLMVEPADLESERVRFFAKTKSNQIECIETVPQESIKPPLHVGEV